MYINKWLNKIKDKRIIEGLLYWRFEFLILGLLGIVYRWFFSRFRFWKFRMYL